jgi:hypothetical protein
VIIVAKQGYAPSAGPNGPLWGAAFSDLNSNTFLLIPQVDTLLVADTRALALQIIPDEVLILR